VRYQGYRRVVQKENNSDTDVAHSIRGLMTVKNTSLAPGVRDSHWRATQAELHSIQRRGEYSLIASVGALIVGAILLRDRVEGTLFWLSIAGAAFVFFVAEVFYVASRKRRIAAARGLVCGRCGYVPHDTEINDVAGTHQCPRCAAEL
jgi:hypothetical protein